MRERERWLVSAGAAITAVLTVAAGCGTAAAGNDAASSKADANWRIVQAYLDLDRAWHAKSAEIHRDSEGEERQRRLREERGEHPDIVLAVVAAKAIVEVGDERVPDAARFLVEEPRDLSPTDDQDIEFGWAALKSLAGPDWTVVDAHRAWQRRYQEIIAADIPDDEKRDRYDDLGPAPEAMSAIAAALAILELGPAHEKGRDAAEFLIKPGIGPSASDTALLGARALLGHWPDYDGWADVLWWINGLRPGSGGEEFIAGANSELARIWRIRFFPTYVVVDVDGTILGRTSALGKTKALIEQALDGATTAGPGA